MMTDDNVTGLAERIIKYFNKKRGNVYTLPLF